MSDELFLFLNGEMVPESAARISPFDRGFLWGDGVYEITPCFDGRLFRLEDHLERLYRSLRYVQIDPGMSREAMAQATLELMGANAGRLTPGAMYRLGHWVTRGEDAPSFAAREAGPTTVMMFLRPVDVAALVRGQREGVRLVVPATRRNPPQSLEPRAKVTSRMNQILAELDAAAGGGLSLMLDMNGNVSENSIANFFIARDGVLWTPPEANILEGVTRKVVFELAARLEVPVLERDFTMYDVAQADEFFLTSSAVGVLPVREVDRYRPSAPAPGPITRRLIAAFAEESGYDFARALEEAGRRAESVS